MKRSLGFPGVGAAAAAVLLIVTTGVLSAQAPGPVVSAQPGQRQPLDVPPPEADGVHLTLDQAIRIALANNEDLDVTVNSAEASQFFLFQNMGVFFVDTAKDMCEFTCASLNGKFDEYVKAHPTTAQILNDMEKVVEIATANQVMPQKSTDFYPKLLSGITTYRLDS